MQVTRSELLEYCVSRANRNSAALGFLTRTALAERIALGRVIPIADSSGLCGYLLHGVGTDWMPIFQTYVEPRVRCFNIGTRLVLAALNRAIHRAQLGLTIRVAIDLPAVAFWLRLGFAVIATVPGKGKSKRLLHIMRLPASALSCSPFADVLRSVYEDPRPFYFPSIQEA